MTFFCPILLSSGLDAPQVEELVSEELIDLEEAQELRKQRRGRNNKVRNRVVKNKNSIN